jgi:hypothetical protein
VLLADLVLLLLLLLLMLLSAPYLLPSSAKSPSTPPAATSCRALTATSTATAQCLTHMLSVDAWTWP